MNRLFGSKTFRLIVGGILAFAILVTSLPWLLVFIGHRAYKSEDYSNSAGYWRVATFISWYDRDIPYTDYGNALYRQTKFEAAASQYEKAVPLAPKERVCDIRINWALSLIQLAELSRQTDKKKAISRYADALRAVSAEDCEDNSTAKEEAKKINEQIKDLSKQPDTPRNQNQEPKDTKSVEEKLQDNTGEQQQRNAYNNRQTSEENRAANEEGIYDFAY